jgi:beta-galactosidase
MWSIGNEVPERALASGLNITSELFTELKKLDTSRPVTESICNFWDNPGMTWPDAQPAFELLEVSGYNYEWSKYEKDHRDYPDRVMYGSETFPLEAWENWQQALKLPFVIGGFVWTANDYIGEASIGRSAYIPEDPGTRPGTGWPWYVAWCGDIDILGNKKAQSYYRDVVWGNSHLEMMVHAPIPEGKKEFISRWGWPDELSSWTWPGAEGENLEVRVFTNYPSVVLKLNGEKIARKTLKPEDKITAVFNVKYTAGELEVLAYDQGKEMESLSFSSAGKTDHILLEAERTIIHAANDELIFVKVKALDEKGNWVPTDGSTLHVAVSGAGELLAAGNGSPWIQGSFRDERFELFQGRGQIIIRPLGHPGEIGIRVSGEFIPDSEIMVTVK